MNWINELNQAAKALALDQSEREVIMRDPVDENAPILSGPRIVEEMRWSVGAAVTPK